MDRYITIVIWTVRTYIEQIEAAMFVIKLAVVVTLAFYCLAFLPQNTTHMIMYAAFVLALLIQTYVAWHRVDQKPDDFWTKQFRKSASNNSGITETYADKIGKIVENLVDEALAKEWGKSSKDSP
jgi:membrane protein implicated in regulation of membrane protease activity